MCISTLSAGKCPAYIPGTLVGHKLELDPLESESQAVVSAM